ncbi:MAG TPA: 6-phosphogluconolactonase [Verrucomicrobiales bacterium]|nr:6-phosphogluconolactonase [Verrucomicrobiales bacterium]
MCGKPEPEIVLCRDFSRDAARWIGQRIASAQAGGRLAAISLCGGGTPRPVYEALAGEPGIDWARLRLTFSDERCVPPDHPQSNYGMARESLLERVPVVSGQVLRLEGEAAPEEAARRSEAVLRLWAAERAEAVFRHDVILLGVGEDGHTASLFPGTAALNEQVRWVVPNAGPDGSVRLTFTFPLLNAARTVAFLVEGERKRAVVERALEGSDDPAAQVRPEAGSVTWLVG